MQSSLWWGDNVILNKNIPALNAALRRIEPSFRLSVRQHVPKPVSELVMRCTAFKASDRPTFSAIKEDVMTIWYSLGGSAYQSAEASSTTTSSATGSPRRKRSEDIAREAGVGSSPAHIRVDIKS